MGLDLGERRIGVAVSDRAGRLAVGHGVVERTGDDATDLAALAAVVEELEAERVVVGLPLSLDGTAGPAAQRAQADAAALAEAVQVPVDLVDERLTTSSATRSLAAAGVGGRARRRVVDEVAATIILQSWLDGQKAAVLSDPRMELS